MSKPSANYETVERFMSAAACALEAGDYATAERKAVAAQAIMVALPTSQAKTGYAGGSMTYNPEHINEFLANVRRLRADAAAEANEDTGGLVFMPIRMTAARCGADRTATGGSCGCY